MALGTSKTQLLIWAVALPPWQARQRAEHATVLHGWSLGLKSTEQKHEISCPSLQSIVAHHSLNTAAGRGRDEVGMGDQRVSFLCNLGHHDAVSTEHLGGGKPKGAGVSLMARRGCREEGETGRCPYITDSAFYCLLPLKRAALLSSSLERTSGSLGSKHQIGEWTALLRKPSSFTTRLPLHDCYPVKDITLKCNRFLAWG